MAAAPGSWRRRRLRAAAPTAARALWALLGTLTALAASSAPPALLRFEAWFAAAGGRWAAGVAAVASAAPRCGGRAEVRVLTTARVPRETTLVAAPHELLLTPLPPASCEPCDAHELLALRLLAERRAGARSPWAPYIALLLGDDNGEGAAQRRRPAGTGASAYSDADAAAHDEVLFTAACDNSAAAAFSAAELDVLEHTYAGSLVAATRARVRRFVRRSRLALRGAHAHSDAALRWALGVVLSRAFTVGHPLGMSARETAALYDVPFLAPGCDLLNHSPLARVGWTLRATAAQRQLVHAPNTVIAEPLVAAGEGGKAAATGLHFAVVALEPYARAGLEVFNCYHEAASNAHLMAHFGFTASAANPFDGVAVSLPLLPLPPPLLPAPQSRAIHAPPPQLIASAVAAARLELVAHARDLQEAGRASAAEVDAVAALLPGFEGGDSGSGSGGGARGLAEGAGVLGPLASVTAVVRGTGSGPAPPALLNVARLALLGSPDVVAWLDALAAQHGGGGAGGDATGRGLRARVISVGNVAPATPGHLLVPASGEHEVLAAEAALRARLRRAARQGLEAALGPVRAQALVPSDRDADEVEAVEFAVHAASAAQQQVLQPRRAAAPPLVLPLSAEGLLGAGLQLGDVASALLDVRAYTLLSATVRRLLARALSPAVPVSNATAAAGELSTPTATAIAALIREDERELARSRGALKRAEVACQEGEVLGPDGPDAEGLLPAQRVQSLRRRVQALQVRVDEARLLGGAAAQLDTRARVLAAELAAHGVALGAWEAAAAVGLSAAWEARGHVHEREGAGGDRSIDVVAEEEAEGARRSLRGVAEPARSEHEHAHDIEREREAAVAAAAPASAGVGAEASPLPASPASASAALPARRRWREDGR